MNEALSTVDADTHELEGPWGGVDGGVVERRIESPLSPGGKIW